MSRRTNRLLAPTFALTFSLLAFIFGVLAISSKEWAVRHAYEAHLNVWEWKTPIFTIYRGPFTVCSAVANSTSSTGPIGWNVTCVNYRASGFGRTSCELGIATLSDTVPEFGDARLCQQIHLAGHFVITSVVFITLGFMLTALLALASVATAFSRGESSEVASAQKKDEVKDATAEGIRSEPPSQHSQGAHEHRRVQRRHSALVPFINLSVLTFLFIGAIAALICQFYAVEGFIQSQPNNADFAGSLGSSGDDVNTKGNHGPWYQGIALSVYMTCAWAFAAASAIVSAKTWRLPQWEIVP